MKKTGRILMRSIFLSLLVASSAQADAQADVQADNLQTLLNQSRQAAKTLGMELKQTLQMSMKKKGPVDSISVCNMKAPEITARVSLEKNMKVARTSLKVRNPENKPDAWEENVLKDFEKRKEQGEPVKQMEYFELTKRNGENVFRYMKAIPTGEVCLTCHGENVSGLLADKIHSLYPDDRATGFNTGDIRGAFTVTIEVQ